MGASSDPGDTGLIERVLPVWLMRRGLTGIYRGLRSSESSKAVLEDGKSHQEGGRGWNNLEVRCYYLWDKESNNLLDGEVAIYLRDYQDNNS